MDRTSYMIMIPGNEKDLEDPQEILRRIRELPGLRLLGEELSDGQMELEIMYHDAFYQASISPAEFGTLPAHFRQQHSFCQEEVRELETREIGLCVNMEFLGDPLAAYHLQLKLGDAACAGALAVFDVSAEKIVSGRWVSLAAASNVPPSPGYLFTVQAVSDGEGEVWLHTHGLNRCGVTELEILGCTQENYGEQCHVIEMMAERLLERDRPLEPGEPFFLARLSEWNMLVTALLPWREAIRFYDESILGGIADREQGNGHDGETSCIFVYASEEDCKKGTLSQVSVFDEILAENPLYMLSTRETERMKALALERLQYLRESVGVEGRQCLVKLGIPVEDGGITDKEHIWFALREMSDAMLVAELINEPYYIQDLKCGDVGSYPVYMITDWLIVLEGMSITPDTVYLLDYIA